MNNALVFDDKTPLKLPMPRLFMELMLLNNVGVCVCVPGREKQQWR